MILTGNSISILYLSDQKAVNIFSRYGVGYKLFVASGVPKFYQLRGPEDEEVCDIVIVITDKIIAHLRQLNYLPAENDESAETTAPFDQEFADSEQLTVAAFASNSMKIAFGINAGKNVRRIGKTFGFTGEHALIKSTRCASANGFTLHANRNIGENERHKLEKLLSYAARPAFSHKRLSLKDPQDPDSDFVYELKAQWTDGIRAIQLSREELLEKLAALIPPPYIHLSRHFGVLDFTVAKSVCSTEFCGNLVGVLSVHSIGRRSIPTTGWTTLTIFSLRRPRST